ncbi:hypothetical protein A4X13_0g8749 [Tilletia indica]|uniref:Uncharacterized protein n=1 Tax=Tilletia indica TaxID=43049 RepID=A0A177SYA5_9BASI|nr:hypothetical protein A4X13_0g8749 [Tilletia indica]
MKVRLRDGSGWIVKNGSGVCRPFLITVQQGSASIGSFRCIALQVLPRSPTNMAESTQHKLDRIRPPRVQITYDVEIGNAIEKKELPLVVGILADLSGRQPGGTQRSGHRPEESRQRHGQRR